MTPGQWNRMSRITLGFAALALISAGPADDPPASSPREDGWIALFNGKDLEGWTPKIQGYELGENFGDTFRVEDGVLKVSYDQYNEFGRRFGHLFTKSPYSHYKLRVEYRFVGEQAEGGEAWAYRNSGAMLHCQKPETMRKDQDFPVCVEAQFLGGREEGERHTNNLCTPGTHVEIDGKLVTQHCIDSTSKTIRGDDWVTVEMEVHGDELLIHRVDGEEVLRYTKPQYDDTDPDAKKLIEAQGGDHRVTEGYIALQSESHPIEFRKVELLPLDE